MKSALVIERQAAAEVRPLDESDREPAEGRVIGGKQAVNTPADDEQVIAVAGEGVQLAVDEVAAHARTAL